MTLFVTTHGDVGFPVHDSWTERCLTDVTDSTLRDTLLQSARIADRIVSALLLDAFGWSPKVPATSALAQAEATLVERMGPDFNKRVGLMWRAPILAEKLLRSCPPQLLEDFSRADLHLVLCYRDHCAPHVAGSSSDDIGYEADGEACILSWLLGRNSDFADRLCLTFPSAMPDNRSVRAALVDRLLADPSFLGGL